MTWPPGFRRRLRIRLLAGLAAALTLTPGLGLLPALGLLPGAVLAQAQTPFPSGGGRTGFAGTMFSTQSSLFPDDGRIKLLALGLNPFGLTESATEQMGLILQKNLSNTGHFAVVGPREMNAAFEKEHANLVDCREIACGVESGKILGADRVLVGTIRREETRFLLRIRLIDPSNNLTDYEEEIRYTDATMDDDLFGLANSISRNSLRQGRVLSTSVRGLVISLGKRQGLKIGDQLVIYKQDVPITSLEGEQIDVQRKNIAIVKVLNVNENTIEATLVHQTEEPQVGHYAITYLDAARQIELVENARRELDVGIRLANKVRPLELAPVILADSEKKKWQRRLQEAQVNQDFWLGIAGVGAAATAYSLNFYDSSSFGQLRLYGSAAVTGYGLYRWLQIRNDINQLNVEGRAKGFVWDWAPGIGPGGLMLSLNAKF